MVFYKAVKLSSDLAHLVILFAFDSSGLQRYGRSFWFCKPNEK